MNINVHILSPPTSRKVLFDCFAKYGAVLEVLSLMLALLGGLTIGVGAAFAMMVFMVIMR